MGEGTGEAQTPRTCRERRQSGDERDAGCELSREERGTERLLLAFMKKYRDGGDKTGVEVGGGG